MSVLTRKQKVEKIKTIFLDISPKEELSIEDDGDDTLIYGPFPSFILLVKEFGPVHAIIHVNADAPNLAYILSRFQDELDIVIDGPFAVNGETGDLIMGPDAYAKKEENILMFARDILAKRQNSTHNQLFVPEEKKIILTS